MERILNSPRRLEAQERRAKSSIRGMTYQHGMSESRASYSGRSIVKLRWVIHF